MLRRLPRLVHLGSNTLAWSEGCYASGSVRAMSEARGASTVLEEAATARLKKIKTQLEATGELPVEAPSSGGWRFARFIWRTLLLGAGAAGAASAYYTYAYTTDELTAMLKRTRAEGKDQPLSEAWCTAMERYLETRKNLEARVKEFTDPSTDKLLPDLPPQLRGNVITLVLDLDDLLVAKEWTRQKGWLIYKRPGVQEFLMELGQYFEIVVYTDEPATYTDPILNKLDPHRAVTYRLYRTDTQYHDGKHVRDLSKLNRDLDHVLMISAKPEVWKGSSSSSSGEAGAAAGGAQCQIGIIARTGAAAWRMLAELLRQYRGRWGHGMTHYVANVVWLVRRTPNTTRIPTSRTRWHGASWPSQTP